MTKIISFLFVFIFSFSTIACSKVQVTGEQILDATTINEYFDQIEIKDAFSYKFKVTYRMEHKTTEEEQEESYTASGVVNMNEEGVLSAEYQIKYKAFLPNITKETEDDFEIEIDPIAESCMVAGVASWIAIDNPEIYDVLNNEYNNLLANLSQIPETVNEHTNGIARIGGWYW